MAANRSDASALAWILAIEAFASFSELDTSLLIDLVKKAPGQISENVGENAREKVSLRILESLSAQKKGVTCSVSPKSDSEVGFDQSESCGNVLREILPKLKDAILEDNHLIHTYLKEMSGLLITNHSDGNTQISEGSDTDVQEIFPTRNSLSSKRVSNMVEFKRCKKF